MEIFLTDAGENLLSRILEDIEALDLPLKGLTEEEADTLSNLLTKMRRYGNKIITCLAFLFYLNNTFVGVFS